MRTHPRWISGSTVVTLLGAVALAGAPWAARAQDADGGETRRDAFASIAWEPGPANGKLGSVARLAVPEGCRFTEAAGARKFMELTENPPSGDEEGVLFCAPADSAGDPWFVVFSYDSSGYVRDDEKGKLDADEILASIREGTESANRERRSRGWGTLTIDGWVRPPYYDRATNNLTWSLRSHASDDADPGVNHSVRLLGRGGVLHADLVVSASQLEAAAAAFDGVIAGTTFVPGHTYAEWREGDKVAAYGLTALVAGGAGAAAVKLGLFGKLWKLVLGIAIAAKKLIVLVVMGVAGWVRSLFRKRDESAEPRGAA